MEHRVQDLPTMNPQTKESERRLVDKIHTMTDDVKSKTNEFKSKTTDFVDEAGHRMGDAMENANEKAADLKHRAEVGYQTSISPKIDSAQVSIAGASRYLQEKSFPDYIADLEEFAKRHPRVTAGVSLFLGWKIGRALTFGK